MDQRSLDTQKKILDAARSVFVKKGMAGARMQEIADEAGINKAMLHYYYRNKEKLFQQVFHEALHKLFRPLADCLMRENSLFDKIRDICLHYFEFLSEYPFVPNFVIAEIYRDPQRITSEIEAVDLDLTKTLEQVKGMVQRGEIRPIDPRELFMNIIALSVFPTLSRPVAQKMLFKDVDYDLFLKSRVESVSQFIINAISISPHGDNTEINKH